MTENYTNKIFANMIKSYVSKEPSIKKGISEDGIIEEWNTDKIEQALNKYDPRLVLGALLV